MYSSGHSNGVQNAQVRTINWKQDRHDDTAKRKEMAAQVYSRIKFMAKLWSQSRFFIPSRSGVAQVDVQRVLDPPIDYTHQSDLIDHSNKVTLILCLSIHPLTH